MESIQATQLRWAGHVVRMPDVPDEQPPKTAPLWRALCRKMSHKSPEKTIQRLTEDCFKTPGAWEEIASDCPAWRNKVSFGITEFEVQRISYTIQKRQQYKERTCNPPPPEQQLHPCPQCDHLFRAQMGLSSPKVSP